jgi:hypothetical protein
MNYVFIQWQTYDLFNLVIRHADAEAQETPLAIPVRVNGVVEPVNQTFNARAAQCDDRDYRHHPPHREPHAGEPHGRDLIGVDRQLCL